MNGFMNGFMNQFSKLLQRNGVRWLHNCAGGSYEANLPP